MADEKKCGLSERGDVRITLTPYEAKALTLPLEIARHEISKAFDSEGAEKRKEILLFSLLVTTKILLEIEAPCQGCKCVGSEETKEEESVN